MDSFKWCITLEPSIILHLSKMCLDFSLLNHNNSHIDMEEDTKLLLNNENLFKNTITALDNSIKIRMSLIKGLLWRY